MPRMTEVAQAKEINKGLILAKPNVVGVGVGYRERRGRSSDELCVLVLVERKIPAAGLNNSDMIPKDLDGVTTDVIEVGLLRAMQGHTDRWRPAPAGVSVGHYQVTAGTLGAAVRDLESGDRLILSNNHVLANINQARLGDPILQPGSFDGGREGPDTLAVLTRYEPIRFNLEPPSCSIASGVASSLNAIARLLGSSHRLQAIRSQQEAINRIDAAVARPLSADMLLDEILEIGVLAGTAPAVLGMRVRKSGRTTGLTSGQIRVLEATVDVDYGGRSARFDGQILTSPMSEPGDSGSVLVTEDGLLAVGLLFAGSQQSTVFNPIQWVLDSMRIRL